MSYHQGVLCGQNCTISLILWFIHAHKWCHVGRCKQRFLCLCHTFFWLHLLKCFATIVALKLMSCLVHRTVKMLPEVKPYMELFVIHFSHNFQKYTSGFWKTFPAFSLCQLSFFPPDEQFNKTLTFMSEFEIGFDFCLFPWQIPFIMVYCVRTQNMHQVWQRNGMQTHWCDFSSLKTYM